MINQLYCLYLTGKIRKVLTANCLAATEWIDCLVISDFVLVQCKITVFCYSITRVKVAILDYNISLANGKHPSIKIEIQ